jgi:hypothetical protein
MSGMFEHLAGDLAVSYVHAQARRGLARVEIGGTRSGEYVAPLA